jgi:hypothetical protein
VRCLECHYELVTAESIHGPDILPVWRGCFYAIDLDQGGSLAFTADCCPPSFHRVGYNEAEIGRAARQLVEVLG